MPAPPPPPPPGPGLAVTLYQATRTVRADGRPKAVLDTVTLHLPAGEFVAVIGPSGSGKSTLVKAVAGVAPVTGGEVRLGGVPLPPDRLRVDRRVAYLPQDEVVHEALTPLAALRYAARLRGLDGPDRRARAALDRVGLGPRAEVPMARLSGGQRKRAALAAELLGDPGLLLLDEPTSGLDPATEAAMMRLFRSLADEGRTVVCVTHAPAQLRMCDRVVCMADGVCVFHGPPPQLAQFFQVSRPEEMYPALAGRAAADWKGLFAKAAPGRQGVPTAAAAGGGPAARPAPPFGEQLAVHLSRYARLLAADRRALLLLLAQAPVIGLMVGLTFGDIRSAFAEQHAADARQVLFVLTVAVLWCAGAASAREVVKELAVVRHEARYGLDLRAYMLSKAVLLGGLAVVQAGLLVVVVGRLAHPPGPADAQLAVLATTAVAGVGLGLLVSAAAGTSERAMTLLPVALIGLAVFSGGLARLAGPAEWAARVGSPAYWAFDGLKAPLAPMLRTATYPGAPGSYQPPILGSGGPLGLDLVALGVQAAVLLAAAVVVLRRRLWV